MSAKSIGAGLATGCRGRTIQLSIFIARVEEHPMQDANQGPAPAAVVTCCQTRPGIEVHSEGGDMTGEQRGCDRSIIATTGMTANSVI